MSMSTHIELFCALHFVLIGLSHLFRHKEWAEVINKLERLESGGAFLSGMVSLTMGSVIVVFHNVWTEASVVLTVIGWAMVLKAAMWLLFPALGKKSLAQGQAMSSNKLRVAGGALIALAVYCMICALFFSSEASISA